MTKLLLSWVARNNDPYERQRDLSFRHDAKGQLVVGPTLSLLFEPSSSLCGEIRRVVLLYRQETANEAPVSSQRIAEETRAAIHERDPTIAVELLGCSLDSPIDHQAIFRVLRDLLPSLRQRFPSEHFVIHLSPGTSAMHTIWVLMAETGFVAPPFEMVQSFRGGGGVFVSPVSVGMETFYRVYQQTRSNDQTFSKQQVFWDPGRFRSARLRSLYEEAAHFARLRVPVLLLGERGTGKTTLASWIRYQSPYRQADRDTSWPSVACGMYSPELMRAELFGYCKGAFTGALRDKEGLLAQADRDTLFLDEIGDLSLEVQRLLVRALEDGRYEPIGALESLSSHFRLISATNLSWDTLQERLSADFLDRISYLTLTLPPLREIPEEIPWLWEQVYQQAHIRAGGALVEPLSADVHKRIVKALQEQPLRGNLRDLFRVAYRLIAFLQRDTLPSSTSALLAYALEPAVLPEDTSQKSLEKKSDVFPSNVFPPPQTDRHAQEIIPSVFRSFLQGEHLDGVLSAASPLPTREIFDALRRYLAEEIRRSARVQQVSPAKLCDMTERALLKWLDK
ncbi:MAG: sigma 54-interacting transcriptional regulator [Myxococcales bacterium]|nr:sigma 54-interacting transcriptional regulator [Myxococcales bacterium]